MVRHPGRAGCGGDSFLALKIALVQPIMLCGFFVLILAGSVAPLVSTPGIFVMWILTFRWPILDQRGRCPVCLRVLTDAVRIVTPRRRFWTGMAPSRCARAVTGCCMFPRYRRVIRSAAVGPWAIPGTVSSLKQ